MHILRNTSFLRYLCRIDNIAVCSRVFKSCYSCLRKTYRHNWGSGYDLRLGWSSDPRWRPAHDTIGGWIIRGNRSWRKSRIIAISAINNVFRCVPIRGMQIPRVHSWDRLVLYHSDFRRTEHQVFFIVVLQLLYRNNVNR